MENQVQNFENQEIKADVLDFTKNKVLDITLDQLKRSHKENNIFGNPITGMHHIDIINNIMENCDKNKLHPEIYDLFAAQNTDRACPGVSVLPRMEDKYGKNAVEATILRRVFANIRLSIWDDETFTTNIAFAFHQKGIQLAIGNMVMVCHNQVLLGKSDSMFFSTYNEPGINYKATLDIYGILKSFNSLINQLEELIYRQREVYHKLIGIQLSTEDLYALIGALSTLRIKADTRNFNLKNHKTYPLGQSQLNKFVENITLKFMSDENKGKSVSLWDVYNSATDLYKGNLMEIPNILPQNIAFSRFLEERYML